MAEAFIIDACRTPRGIGKVGRGALAHLHPQARHQPLREVDGHPEPDEHGGQVRHHDPQSARTDAEQEGEQDRIAQQLAEELDDVRRLSSNVIKVDSQNKSLRLSLAESQAMVEKLQADNKRLGSRANREWFIIGSLVVIVGMLIGLILPRVRWRKKSSWGDL